MNLESEGFLNLEIFEYLFLCSVFVLFYVDWSTPYG